MERADAPRLVDGRRPGLPGQRTRILHPHLRVGDLGADDGARAAGRPAARRRLDELPVPPRRAGRADLRLQDRADGPGHGLQVLRGHADDGRGSARGDVLPVHPGEDRPRLPDQPSSEGPAQRGHLRRAMGHDVSRDAGRDRGAGPGRLRPHP